MLNIDLRLTHDIDNEKVTIKARCALAHKATSPDNNNQKGGVTEIRELKALGEEISVTPKLASSNTTSSLIYL